MHEEIKHVTDTPKMNCNISTGLKGKQICVSIVLCYNVCVCFRWTCFFSLVESSGFNRPVHLIGVFFFFCLFFFGILVSFPWLIRIKSTNAIKLDKHFNRIKKKSQIIMQLEKEGKIRKPKSTFDYLILYVWLRFISCFRSLSHILRF